MIICITPYDIKHRGGHRRSHATPPSQTRRGLDSYACFYDARRTGIKASLTQPPTTPTSARDSFFCCYFFSPPGYGVTAFFCRRGFDFARARQTLHSIFLSFVATQFLFYVISWRFMQKSTFILLDFWGWGGRGGQGGDEAQYNGNDRAKTSFSIV